MNKTKVLFLCTGNSCRSQMAMRLMQALDDKLEVHSAGTVPADAVNPYAVRAMQEIGLDMADAFPKTVDRYLDEPWDYVITVCDNAKETCPIFHGKVACHLHLGFPDPALATGSDEEIMEVFRNSRDNIRTRLEQLYTETITKKL